MGHRNSSSNCCSRSQADIENSQVKEEDHCTMGELSARQIKRRVGISRTLLCGRPPALESDREFLDLAVDNLVDRFIVPTRSKSAINIAFSHHAQPYAPRLMATVISLPLCRKVRTL
jgi:hypothetical protein